MGHQSHAAGYRGCSTEWPVLAHSRYQFSLGLYCKYLIINYMWMAVRSNLFSVGANSTTSMATILSPRSGKFLCRSVYSAEESAQMSRQCDDGDGHRFDRQAVSR